MKKITEFVISHCFTIMLTGMIVAITGVISYMYFNSMRFRFTPMPSIAMTLAIIGFAIYFIGRIALAIQRRRNYYGKPSSTETKDDDD